MFSKLRFVFQVSFPSILGNSNIDKSIKNAIMPFVRNGFGQKRRTLTTMDTTRMVAMFLAACFFLFLGLAGVLAPSESPVKQKEEATSTTHTTTESCAQNAQEKETLRAIGAVVKSAQYCVPQYLECETEERGSCMANMHLCLQPFEEIDISHEGRLLPITEENLAKIPECDAESRKIYGEILARRTYTEAQKVCAFVHSKCLKTDNNECLKSLSICVSNVAKNHPFRPPAGDVMVSN